MKYLLIAALIGTTLAGCLPEHYEACNSSYESHETAAQCFNHMTHKRLSAPIGASEGGE